MRVIKAPEHIKAYRDEPVIFLAGSIEMGAAVNWQAYVEKYFHLYEHGVLLNPRRDDWDPSWEQSLSNPNFTEQVQWELDAMDAADVILMHFEPGTKSPITLLELGLYATSGKLVVHCPEGFWRKGNVDFVCRRFGIERRGSLEEACCIVRGLWRTLRLND